MLDQRTERRRFEFRPGALVQIGEISHDVVFPLALS